MFATDRMEDACHKLMRLLRKVRRFIANPLRSDLARNADHPLAHCGELHLSGGTHRCTIVRSKECVPQRAVVKISTVASFTFAARQDLRAEALRESVCRSARHIRRCAKRRTVDLNANLGEFGNPRRLRNRRLGVESAHRTRRELQRATRRGVSASASSHTWCAVICGDAH